MGIQEALEFFEIPKGWHQTLENVRGKIFAVDALYLIQFQYEHISRLL